MTLFEWFVDSISSKQPSFPLRYVNSLQGIEIYRSLLQNKRARELSADYPLLAEYLGEERFRETVALPFLEDDALSFEQWMREKYTAEDSRLIGLLIEQSKVLKKISTASRLPPFELSAECFDAEALLQPHVHLQRLDCNLFEVVNERTPLSWQPTHYILFRNHESLTSYEAVTEAEFHFLKHFQIACSCNRAIDNFEKEGYEGDSLECYSSFIRWSKENILTQTIY